MTEKRDSQSGTQTRRQTCRNNMHHTVLFCPRQLYICRFNFVNGIVRQSIPPPPSPNPQPRGIVRTKSKFETKHKNNCLGRTLNLFLRKSRSPKAYRKASNKNPQLSRHHNAIRAVLFPPPFTSQKQGRWTSEPIKSTHQESVFFCC